MSHRKRKNRRSPQPAAAPQSNPARVDDAIAPAVESESTPTPDAEIRAAQPAADSDGAVAPVDAVAEVHEGLVPPEAPEPLQPLESASDIGQRLEHARKAMGIDVATAAKRLKLPLRVLEKLEQGDWSGISSPVYLRGYLRSYCGLLGVAEPELEAEVTPVAPTAPLESIGALPRSHYLLQRYATAAAYLGLTALVVVPMTLLGLHGGLKPNLSRVTPLDPPTIELPKATTSATTGTTDAASASSETDANKPLMASMAPVGLLDRELKDATTAPAPQAPPPAVTANEGSHQIALSLDAPSWVEIHGADGSRIEYALLQPGSYHYEADGAVDVRLGNSQGATLTVDGTTRAIDGFRRANVAHFEIDGNGKLQPPRG